MTTELKRPLTRVCLMPHRGRKLVVAFVPCDLLTLRQQYTRQEEVISLAAVYDFAVKQRVEREKWEKAQARRGRKS